MRTKKEIQDRLSVFSEWDLFITHGELTDLRSWMLGCVAVLKWVLNEKEAES